MSTAHEGEIDRRVEKWRARFIAAVQRDQIALAKRLLYERVACDTQDNSLRVLLRIAVQNGSLKMVELLLAAPNLSVSWETSGRELVEIAAKKPHVRILQLLMKQWAAYAKESSAILWPRHERGPKPYPIVAALENGNLWQLMLIHGADGRLINSRIPTGPNMEDGAEGWTTPLHLAVLKGNRVMVAALIALGSNLKGVDSKGLFAHEVAMEHGSREMLALLRAFDSGRTVQMSESLWRRKRVSNITSARNVRIFRAGIMVIIAAAIAIGAVCVGVAIFKQRDVRSFILGARIEPIQFNTIDVDGNAWPPMISPAVFSCDSTRWVRYEFRMDGHRQPPQGHYPISAMCLDGEGVIILEDFSPPNDCMLVSPNELLFSGELLTPYAEGWQQGLYTVIVRAYGNTLAQGTFEIQ